MTLTVALTTGQHYRAACDDTVSTGKMELDNDDDDEGTDSPLPDVHVKPSTRKFYEENKSEVSISHLHIS